jgi:hypothetical protein
VGSVFGPVRFLLPVCRQEVGIWRVKKCFPRYGVPIWSLWPNTRFLPSIVAEKNATKNGHIQNVCSMCIKRYTVLPPSVLPSVQDIFRHIFLSNCWWQKSDIWSQVSYRYTILWVAFLDPSGSYFDWIVKMDTVGGILPSSGNKMNCELMLTYDTPALRQIGSKNLTGLKTLPTICGMYK